MERLGLFGVCLAGLLVFGQLVSRFSEGRPQTETFPFESEAANVAVGRSGSMRPGKRTLALGRFNFRPGKRSSLALGRSVPYYKPKARWSRQAIDGP